MSDEQFMRAWNSGHARFSADLHRYLRRVRRRLSPRPVSVTLIGRPYDSAAQGALLRGFAASVATTALFLGGIVALTAPPVDPAALVRAVIVDGGQSTGPVELA
jgi:hypothetical protein